MSTKSTPFAAARKASEQDAYSVVAGNDDMDTPLVQADELATSEATVEMADAEALARAEADSDGPGAATLGPQAMKEQGERNPETTAWRDWPWGMVFWLHVFLIFIVACTVGANVQRAEAVDDRKYENGMLQEVDDKQSKGGNQSITGGVFLLVFVTGSLAMIYMGIMLRLAERIITVMTFANIAVSVFLGVIFLSVGFIAGAIIFFLYAAIYTCFYMRHKDKIPFAGTNLKIACTATLEMPLTIGVAFTMVAASLVWVVIWSFALYGAVSGGLQQKEVVIEGIHFRLNECYNVLYTDDSEKMALGCHCQNTEYLGTKGMECLDNGIDGGLWFLMLISLYWGAEVFANVIHVTVAGAVAGWWFDPDAASPVRSAWRRAMTTSFGSIALGSLMVAVLRAVRQLCHSLRRNRQVGVAIAICIDCLLSYIEMLLRYFNRYAFTYVGIYGYDFRTAGRAVWDLLERRRLTVLVNDVLVDRALVLGALLVGGVGCGVGWGYAQARGLATENIVSVAFLGFFMGFVLTSTATNVISSAVATIFVCFAEDPDPFARNHPHLHDELVTNWRRVYPSEYEEVVATRSQV